MLNISQAERLPPRFVPCQPLLRLLHLPGGWLSGPRGYSPVNLAKALPAPDICQPARKVGRAGGPRRRRSLGKPPVESSLLCFSLGGKGV